MEVLMAAEGEAPGWSRNGGWGNRRAREGRDSCLLSPRQVPRAVAWLAPALLFTSWEREQEEVPGSLPTAAWLLASWPVG